MGIKFENFWKPFWISLQCSVVFNHDFTINILRKYSRDSADHCYFDDLDNLRRVGGSGFVPNNGDGSFEYI